MRIKIRCFLTVLLTAAKKSFSASPGLFIGLILVFPMVSASNPLSSNPAGAGYSGGMLATAQQAVEIVFELSEESRTAPITVGDEFVLMLQILHPAGTRVEMPQLPASWGSFEVRAQSVPETSALAGGDLRTHQEITAALFEPGEHTTPAFSIRVLTEDGSIVEAAVPQLTIPVQSVLLEDDTALRDIRPQANMDPPFPWGWLFGVLLAGLAALTFIRLQRARSALPELSPAPEPIPPHLTAVNELARIESLRLPEQKRFKEHYSLLDAALRRYLEQTFGLPAVKRTTAEIAHILQESNLPVTAQSDLAAILEASDEVKFARHTPSIEDAYQHLQAARSWVIQTSPSPSAREGLRPEPPEDTP